MPNDSSRITRLILQAGKEARGKRRPTDPSLDPIKTVDWPVDCTVGPGLEGAIACESKVGYVNGSQGWLTYRGYSIFDLCARSSFEEVSYLLLHGELPAKNELTSFESALESYRHLPDVMRLLMTFPVEEMNTMAALRLGTNLMRQKQTYRDKEQSHANIDAISADEDTDPMETYEAGHAKATYEFKGKAHPRPRRVDANLRGSEGLESCYHLIAGVATTAAAIMRLRGGHLPLEPDPSLSHAGNLLYMMTGRQPTPIETRIMDVSLILHADHGMNASTFSSMVVASTLSDIYFAVGSGIAALNGALHGGANAAVLQMLREIGKPRRVDAWYAKAKKEKRRVTGFGHRVYKSYDPRARILKPIARYLVKDHPEACNLFEVAERLEARVIEDIGADKGVFPNVDFFSGLVYGAMGIPTEMFTPLFAVSRVSGWTARVLEYLNNNRIFRPRAIYTGSPQRDYVSVRRRH